MRPASLLGGLFLTPPLGGPPLTVEYAKTSHVPASGSDLFSTRFKANKPHMGGHQVEATGDQHAEAAARISASGGRRSVRIDQITASQALS